MLHKETVAPQTLELLKQLMSDRHLDGFFLVGGTALSLQIGHRISVDIDLFIQEPFDENKLSEYLEVKSGWQLNYLDRNTIKGQINTVQVDFITHAYPLIKNLLVVENIRIASLEDIAAMKLNAVIGNGTRLKDFIDIAFLSVHLSLKQMIDAYEEKYKSKNPVMALKALEYHKDINYNEPIRLIPGAYKWDSIGHRLNEMVKAADKIFSNYPL